MVSKKKWNKLLIIALTTFGLSLNIFSQSIEDVTLTVSGDGVTKKIATDIALRSAIEQAFGVFVSANTSILNDSLVTDEIATISSGNIKKYEEIASFQLPNGNISVTLKATVSISQLVKYVESHGSSVEFAGATFGANMKLKELNKANEIKSIDNMLNQIRSLIPYLFDYKLELEEPKIARNGNYEIDIKVIVIFNNNTEIVNNIIFNTLKSLSLTEQECLDYKNLNIPVDKIKLGNFMDYTPTYQKTNLAGERILKISYQSPFTNFGGSNYTGMYYKFGKVGYSQIGDLYFLRNDNNKAWKEISNLMFEAIYNFEIQDNLNGKSILSPPKGCTNCSEYDWNYPNSTNVNGIYIEQKKAFIMGDSNYGYYSNIFYFGDGIVIPHLYKNLLVKENEQYIPYIINLTMQIPKDDISKYSKFTIKTKQHLK